MASMEDFYNFAGPFITGLDIHLFARGLEPLRGPTYVLGLLESMCIVKHFLFYSFELEYLFLL